MSQLRPAIAAASVGVSTVATTILFSTLFSFSKNFLDAFFTFLFFTLMAYVVLYGLSDNYYTSRGMRKK